MISNAEPLGLEVEAIKSNRQTHDLGKKAKEAVSFTLGNAEGLEKKGGAVAGEAAKVKAKKEATFVSKTKDFVNAKEGAGSIGKIAKLAGAGTPKDTGEASAGSATKQAATDTAEPHLATAVQENQESTSPPDVRPSQQRGALLHLHRATARTAGCTRRDDRSLAPVGA